MLILKIRSNFMKITVVSLLNFSENIIKFSLPTLFLISNEIVFVIFLDVLQIFQRYVLISI